MAEEIKTVFTADSSALAAEFAKASSIAQRYASEREAAGGRALATARAEVGALQLEATGHGAAAAAVREKMQLIEASRRLSAQAGVTEETANSILARQLELKKQITVATQAAAVAAQRAVRIAAPGRNGIGLPQLALTEANLSAMEKTAARANELQRKKAGASGRAGGGSAMGLLAVSQAAEDAQYGIHGVLNNIPQAVMAFGGFTPAAMVLASGLSLVAVAAVVLYQPMKKLLGFMDEAMDAESVKNWAAAATSAAKAISKLRGEAAQGVAMVRLSDQINESLRQRLALQDVAAQFFIQQGKDQSAELDHAKRLLAARQALAQANGEMVPQNSVNADSDSVQSQLANRHKLLAAASAAESGLAERVANVSAESTDRQSAATRKLLTLRENLIGVTASLEAGQKDLAAAEKNKPGFLDTTVRTAATLVTGTAYNRKREEKIEADTLVNLTANQEAREKVKRQIEAQIQLLEKQSGVEEKSSSEAIQAAKQKVDATRATMQATADEIRQLEARYPIEKQLADLEEQRRKAESANAAKDWNQELEIQRALGANDQERVRALERQRDIETEKRSIMLAQKGLAAELAGQQAAIMVDARAAAAGASAAAAAATAKNSFSEELEILRARATGQNDHAGQLRTAANLESEVLAIMQQQNVSRAEATRLSRERTELERNAARGDVIGDLKALKMEAGGDKKGADRLREEMRIRQEAIGLAERMGISESQAQSILREKARLQKQISDQQKNSGRDTDDGYRRAHSRIYTLPKADGTSGLRTSGLRTSELHRRNTERSNRPATPSNDSATNLLKSVNIQEEMLKIWQRLNVV